MATKNLKVTINVDIETGYGEVSLNCPVSSPEALSELVESAKKLISDKSVKAWVLNRGQTVMNLQK